MSPEAPPCTHLRAASPIDEVHCVAELASLARAIGRGRVGVLYSSVDSGMKVCSTLQEAGVPTHSHMGHRLAEISEVRTLVSFLGTIVSGAAAQLCTRIHIHNHTHGLDLIARCGGCWRAVRVLEGATHPACTIWRAPPSTVYPLPPLHPSWRSNRATCLMPSVQKSMRGPLCTTKDRPSPRSPRSHGTCHHPLGTCGASYANV